MALGFATGFLLSLPPDSGSLEAVNRGINRGFLPAFLVGSGSVIGDTLCYGAVFLGFTIYFEKYPFLKFYTVLACFVFLFLAGLYYLLGEKNTRRAWIRKKTGFVVFWFRNPFIFGLLSSMLTPFTLVLTAPFCGMLVFQSGWPDMLGATTGFVLGGILWSAILAFLSARAGNKMGGVLKSLFRKMAGLFYILAGLAGFYLVMMEMIGLE